MGVPESREPAPACRMCFPSAGTGSIPRCTQTILPKARSARRSTQDSVSLLLLFQFFPVCQVRPQISCNQRGPTCTYGLGVAHEPLAHAHPTVSVRLKFHGGRSRIAQLYVQNMYLRRALPSNARITCRSYFYCCAPLPPGGYTISERTA